MKKGINIPLYVAHNQTPVRLSPGTRIPAHRSNIMDELRIRTRRFESVYFEGDTLGTGIAGHVALTGEVLPLSRTLMLIQGLIGADQLTEYEDGSKRIVEKWNNMLNAKIQEEDYEKYGEYGKYLIKIAEVVHFTIITNNN
ncbi:hypothetical protein JTB14_028061 [Gonioctena quinquepunctata]|nr:hypothetical protein JTB14_028061 [Gonioctena quinquepunctata]